MEWLNISVFNPTVLHLNMASVSNVQLNQEKGIVTYQKSYSISPFRFPVYPKSKMRFCIAIISTPQFLQSSKLFEFIRNAFPKFRDISNCKNLQDVLQQLSDSDKSVNTLSEQLSIFDLSPDNQFSKIIPNIISTSEDRSPDYLFSHRILRILFPNFIFGKSQSEIEDKSYSYTVWIAPNISSLPEIIRTNSHFIFIPELEEAKLYVKKYLGVEAALPSNIIFSVCSTLTQDIQIMYLSKDNLAA